jgi:uncharacterized protein (DUF885 family)
LIARRTFLKSAAATAAAAGLADMASLVLADSAPDASKRAAAALNALMDHIYNDIVLSDPELRTSLGLDKGANADAKRRLQDRSAQGLLSDQGKQRDAYARLRAIDRKALSGAAAVDYDTLDFLYSTTVGAYDKFEYGTFSWPEPYTVSQLGGTYISIPDFLHNQHSIATRNDADAYLSRLSAFAKELDHESDRLRAEHNIGVIAPGFVIDRSLALLDGMLAQKPEETVLVKSIDSRTREQKITGNWGVRARQIVAAEVLPALKRQRDRIASIRARAGDSDQGGVWRLPKGDAYYEYALRYATTTSMTAEEIHRMGLEQMAALTSQAEAILKSQGMTQGTVGERMRALATDPRFIYPNTDEGKKQLLADLNAGMLKIQSRLPDFFGRLPKANVEIRRVPVDIEAAATGGYYQAPALDGSRPGAYYINLRDTAETPRWTLTTLTAHEASPGHHHQISLAQESTSVHPLRRLPAFSVYTEGWGLYAEQLADEMGIYEGDPFGRLGYLRSYMFRAARLVVDTGLHYKRWTREQGVAYMVDTMGDHPASVTTEVERYCVWPGQATSYKVGQTTWLRLREDARRKLGNRFDIKGFHDTALAAGTVPLSVLERVINDWVASRQV